MIKPVRAETGIREIDGIRLIAVPRVGLSVSHLETDNPLPWMSETMDLKKEKTSSRRV